MTSLTPSSIRAGAGAKGRITMPHRLLHLDLYWIVAGAGVLLSAAVNIGHSDKAVAPKPGVQLVYEKPSGRQYAAEDRPADSDYPYASPRILSWAGTIAACGAMLAKAVSDHQARTAESLRGELVKVNQQLGEMAYKMSEANARAAGTEEKLGQALEKLDQANDTIQSQAAKIAESELRRAELEDQNAEFRARLEAKIDATGEKVTATGKEVLGEVAHVLKNVKAPQELAVELQDRVVKKIVDHEQRLSAVETSQKPAE